MAIPFGLSDEGSPIGVHTAAGWYNEATILRLGAELELASN
jgi:Asp-tRNA(Asn)/Glu-tRNA(Gln) amidotransferase A subunit family amidase